MQQTSPETQTCWKEGRELVLRGTTVLPRSCLWCGSLGIHQDVKVKAEWTPPVRYWVYLGCLILLVVTVGLCYVLPEPYEATITVWFCRFDSRRRLTYRILSTVFFAIGLVICLPAGGIFIAWSARGIPVLSSLGVRVLLGLIILCAPFVASIYIGRKYKYPVLPNRIDPENQMIRLSGASPKFLDLVPERANPNR